MQMRGARIRWYEDDSMGFDATNHVDHEAFHAACEAAKADLLAACGLTDFDMFCAVQAAEGPAFLRRFPQPEEPA